MKTVKKPNKWKHVVYLILALAMLVYALPLISFDPGAGWVSLFGAVWAGFTFLVIGAHLHFCWALAKRSNASSTKSGGPNFGNGS